MIVRELLCTLSGNITLLFFHTSTKFFIGYFSQVPFFSFSPPLHSRFTPPFTLCVQLIFLSHTLCCFLSYNLRLLLTWTFLSPRDTLLPVRPERERELTCFPIMQITVSKATLHRDARHPVAAAGGSCNLRPRRTTRASLLGSRQMLQRFFPPPPLFHRATVFHECFARLRFSRARLSGMHPVFRSAADRRLSCYFCLRWEVGQFHALCSLKSLFLQTLRVAIFYLWLWSFAFQ